MTLDERPSQSGDSPFASEIELPSQKDERTLSMLTHLGGFLWYLFPFGNVIFPLIVWQVKKDESEYIAYHAKEALNFQISIVIYTILSLLLTMVVIGVVLLGVVTLFNIAMIIVAGIRANDGKSYRYPFTIRFF